MSYLTHWQLNHSPYHNRGAAYPAPSQQEALARIEYLATERRAMGAVVADRGLGKTTVLDEAGRLFTRTGRYAAVVDAFGLTAREMLWQVACAFDVQPALGDSVSRLWQRLADTATEHAWRGESAVVLVDDAGQAGVDLCQQIVRLSRLATNVGAAWTMVAAATSNEAQRWPVALVDLIDLKVELHPWEADTTVDYLQHALMATGRLDPVFTEDALRHVHALAEGNPRQIARLADHALAAGAQAAVPIVDSGIVESAHAQTTWAAKC